ncbi:AbgT family transporter [Thermaerobacillus caldiproteolyticus]|uniref:AbgT family transporter n=1 Tax=Thermaerobacillus caldiproteolyticus TaxID=247480 RepID=UPI0035A89E12
MALLKFPPLGFVLVMIIRSGLADQTGMICALIRRSNIGYSSTVIILGIVALAILGNAVGDAVFIVLPSIAAMVFVLIFR